MQGGDYKRKRSAKVEVSALFNKRRKSRVDTTWKHKFVCLAFKDQTKIPVSIVEKEQLLRCGLGEKEIEFSELDMNADQFKQVLLTEFPSLNKAGGYQFLKCLPNSRKLEVLPAVVHNSPTLLKQRVGTSKTFIRPIQIDLELDVEDSLIESNAEVHVLFACLFLFIIAL